ncbi:MAG: hypothetical protein KAH17_09130 [Bacteroidales bacterium]|nr:hypothetical protein [Bacteroidales bacterium]
MSEILNKITLSGYVFIIVILMASGCKTMQPVIETSDQTSIYWSGLTWDIKGASHKQGPGPNFFSANRKSVWVDEQGQLHMTIRRVNGNWICSEVICAEALGYGKYSFQLSSPVDKLDPNAVLGLFTWRTHGGKHNNEIDIEISRWGNPASPNAQYVVQPYSIPGNMYRFRMSQQGGFSTHEFLWMQDAVYFHSFHGHYINIGDYPEMKSWIYTKSMIPNPKRTQVRINLWLNEPSGPMKKKDIEVVIKAFNFTPLKELR